MNDVFAILIHTDGIIERAPADLDTGKLKRIFLEYPYIAEIGVVEDGKFSYHAVDDYLSQEEMSKWQKKWVQTRDEEENAD